MSNYIPLFYEDVITYLYPNPGDALGNLCYWKRSHARIYQSHKCGGTPSGSLQTSGEL